MQKNICSVASLFLPADVLEKSINEINGEINSHDWRTNLTIRVSEALSKPIKSLCAEEITTLLRQGIGGEITLALGLMLVSEEPMICGDSYCGDILKLVLERSWAEWIKTEKYGVDPYGLSAMIESTVFGLKSLGDELEILCKKLMI